MVWGFFIHANLRWRFGWLEWLLSTPASHHWHNSNDDPAHINQNFAPLFPWIDRLFGTPYLPKDHPPAIYGIPQRLGPGLVDQLRALFAIGWGGLGQPAPFPVEIAFGHMPTIASGSHRRSWFVVSWRAYAAMPTGRLR